MIASARRIQLVASSSAVTHRALSCVIGVTCWLTRAVPSRSGTCYRSCPRKTNHRNIARERQRLGDESLDAEQKGIAIEQDKVATEREGLDSQKEKY